MAPACFYQYKLQKTEIPSSFQLFCSYQKTQSLLVLFFFPSFCFQILNVKRSSLSEVLILLEEILFWPAIFY